MINIIYRSLYIQTLKNVCLCAHVRTRAYVRTLDNPKSTRFLLPTRSTILQPLSSFSILTSIHPSIHPFSLSPFTPIHPSTHPPIYPFLPSTPLTIPSLILSLFFSLSISLSLPPFYFTRTCAHIHDALS